jgi:hypothetical protein
MPARRAGRVALRCIVLAALVAGHRAAFTCGATDNATTCANLAALYAATNGAARSSAPNWAAAAGGTPTGYCTFEGITGSNSQCVNGNPSQHFTWLCVHARPPCYIRRWCMPACAWCHAC